MTTAPSRRLIENWLPINEISVEGIREGGALVGHPPVNQLHVCWARRPSSPSRAAVAASLLNADADHNNFYDLMGTYAGVHYDAQRLAAASAAGVKADSGYANRRAPEAMLCALEIVTRDGKSYTATVPYHKGHYKNPMTDAEVEAKFRSLADPLLPAAQTAALLEKL